MCYHCATVSPSVFIRQEWFELGILLTLEKLLLAVLFDSPVCAWNVLNWTNDTLPWEGEVRIHQHEGSGRQT